MTDTSTATHRSADPAPADAVRLPLAQRILAVGRIALGWVFLWAFLDKNWGLGNTTPSDKAWNFGTGPGNPTKGFLSAVEGPFADFYHGLAGQTWVNWLFMAGLCGIGIGLMSGLAFRFSAICGIILLAMMWTASLPIQNNPFVDDHIIYILLLAGLIPLRNGHVWGFGDPWDRVVGSRVPFMK